MEQEIQKEQTLAYQDTLIISSGQTSTGLIISSGGGDARRVLLSGGVMNETTILTGGALSANSGYISAALMSGAGAFVNAYNSASISQITIQQGTLYASNGVTISGATLQTGGRMDIFAGASVNSAMVVSAGRLVISSNGWASNASAGNNGSMEIRAGSAFNVQLDSGAKLYLSSGSYVDNLSVASGGYISIKNGVRAEHIGLAAGATFAIDVISEANNDISLSGTNEQGAFSLSSAIASGFVMDSGSPFLTVAAGGSLIHTLVKSGGGVNLSSGASASDTTLSGGRMDLLGGQAGSTTILNGGRMIVSTGASASEIDLLSGGVLDIRAGSASGIFVSLGALNISAGGAADSVQIFDTTVGVSAGGTLRNAALETASARVDVYNGAVTENIDITAGRFLVSAGGSASNTSVGNNGSMELRSGSANGIELDSGARLYLSSGANADTVSAGSGAYIYMENGGVLQNAEIADGGRIAVGAAGSGGIRADDFETFVTGSNARGLFSLVNGSASGFNVVSGVQYRVFSGGIMDDTLLGSAQISAFDGGTVGLIDLEDKAYLCISSGGNLSGARIFSGGAIDVYEFGSASDVEVGSGARFYVYSGEADNISVSGGIFVGSGGTLDHISVYDGGNLEIKSGAVAGMVTVNGAGRAYFYETCIANDLVNEGGIMIASGAALQSATLSDGGNLELKLGATIDSVFMTGSATKAYFYEDCTANTLVNEGGIIVASGAALQSASLSDGGSLELKLGATIDSVFMTGSGTKAYFYDVCTANTLVNEGGIIVGSGAALQSATLSDGGNLELKLGAAIDAVFMTGSATKAYFYEDCTANTLVNEGGIIVASGAALQSATLSDGGNLELKLGATIDAVAMTGSATKTYVYSECLADELENDGGIIVASGGTLGSVNMSNGASLELKSGAVLGNANIAGSETKLYLYDSSVASSVDDDGAILIASGGFVSSAGLSNGASLELKSGAELESATVTDGVFYVYNTARAGFVEASNTMMTISGGGIGTLMMTGGEMYVTEGGMISGGTVTDAFLYVSSTGNVSGMKLYGNALLAVSNGAATDDIEVCGSATAGFYGGTAADTFIRDGGFAEFSLNGFEEVFSSSIATNTTVESGGRLEMHSGTRHTGTLTIEDGAVCYFQSSSILDFNISAMSPGNDVIVNDFSLVSGLPDCTVTISAAQETGVYHLADGAVNISENFTVVTTEGDTYGSLYLNEVIEYGSLYYSLTEDAGQLSFLISNEAPVISGLIKVYSSGVFISSASVMENVLLQSNSMLDSMCILQGGSALGTTVNSGGSMVVSRNGGAFDTTLVSGGRIYIRAGGSAEGTVVSNGGLEFVDEGGTAIGNIVASSGFVYVSSGGLFQTGEIRENGRVDILEGGSAENTSILSGGRLIVSSGASAMNAAVLSGGNLEIRDGGAAGSAFIGDLGRALVSSGGLAENAFVGSGGYMWINGGSCFGLDLVAGGSLTVWDEDGLLGGVIRVDDAAVVTVSDVCELNFTVSGMVPEDDALVNNLSIFTGDSFSYSLTVAPDQTDGLYRLAEGADSFESPVAVRLSDSTELGMLSVGGELISGNSTYTLTKTDGILSFTVETEIPPEAPTVSVDITTPTNGNVTVTASFSEDSAERQYSFDNETWLAYTTGIVLSENGTVYFRGISVTGCASAVTSYEVTNIDKVAPEAPTAAADIITPTNGNVTVTALFSEDSIEQQYSLDGETWLAYTTGIVLSENGTVYFRGIDEAGNISDVASYEVTNIDKVAPEAPSASADITTPTTGDVTVTALFSEDSIEQQYSLDGETWLAYDLAGVVLSENGTVYFRGIDEAGNISDVTSYEVTNIYPVEPELPRVNLLENGISQVLAWDAEQGKVGFMATDGNPSPGWHGVWEWPTEYNEYLGASEAELWKVVGAGHFAGSSVDHDGILLYNGIGNTFAAWTDLNDPSYGYVSLCHVDGNFQTKCLADFDGNGFDDVIIYNEVGSVGIVSDAAAYHDVWHVEGDSTEWSLLGAGTFDTSLGQDSILFKNTANNHLYLWDNQGSDVGMWNWRQTNIGWLADGWEFAAIGDFAGDGIDDIVLVNTNDSNAVFVWDNGDQTMQHYVGILGEGFVIETVGDYDGDGKEDLLLREYNSGWGGIGCWSGAEATAWTDFNARIETNMESRFAVIA